MEYFSVAYPGWPTYLCKLAVLGTKAARSVVTAFNPLPESGVQGAALLTATARRDRW